MENTTQYAENDPRHHTTKVNAKLGELVQHLRGDVSKVGDPKAQALFETTAEVLIGLQTAYSHYEKGTETAWKRSA